MHDSTSATLDQHVENLQTIPTDLVERLTTEGLIGMRAAAAMYGRCREGKPTHSSTPTRHGLKGYKMPDGRVMKLEVIRIAGRLMTSRQAVLRFFAAQNQTSVESTPLATPTPTPTARKRAASKASREADAIFGTKSGE
jgi:hypothetical protein